MKVKVQADSLLVNPPTEMDDVSSLVVLDDYDQPVLIVQRAAEGQIYVTGVHDKKFGEALRALSIGLQRAPDVVKL